MPPQEHKQPRLIVGIVVDQVRYDYPAKNYNKLNYNQIKSHFFI